eukprot:scaffold40743_cov233-Skeletonema_dohrnii-CCMP3373.AAC.1
MVVQKTADDSPAAIAALTCNETDALLKVKYDITEDEWDGSISNSNSYRYTYTPFLHLQGNEMIRYENFANLTDYETCLPRDECSEVVVGGLPTYAYKIAFNGKAVDIGQEFVFDGKNPITSTEVGTCTKPPICKDTEALMEIQYWSGSFEYNQQSAFRVDDKGGNIVLHGEPDGSDSVNQAYACLPKDDACYTFLIGGSYAWDIYASPPPSYSVFFDGKPVRRSDSWLFDSVQFGGSCKPRCNEDDESLIEFFLYGTLNSGVDYEYEWDLNVTNRNSSATVSSGVVPLGPGIGPLAHKIMCVPKGSCSSFYISAPTVIDNVTTNKALFLSPVYTLAMDNVTYRKVQWFTPSEFYGTGSDNQTTNMGSCTVGGLCDEQTQDLFDLELRTLPTPQSSEMSWRFGYTEREEDRERQYLLQDSYDYNSLGYDLDSSYGVIECVPKDGCDLSFNMTPESPVESYTVKKNGIQLDDGKEVDDALYYGKVYMTPFGQNCSSPSKPLSGGAIAGIVIACLLSAAVGAIGLAWYKRRQSQSSKEEGEGRSLA